MKLTPQDILNQQFGVRLRGFDQEEIKNFLIQVAETLESEIQEKEALKKELGRLREDLSKLKNREDILRETLIAAQKFSQKIKTNAQKETELIIKEAEMKGEDVISKAVERQKSLKEEIKTLMFRRREIESDIINLLNSLKELIETYRKEDEEFDKLEYLER